jgi:hypothetical protein
LFVSQVQLRGGDVLFQVRAGGRARDGQHERTAAQQPGECQLSGRGAGPAGAGRDHGRDRQPRDEDDPSLLAVPEHILGRAVGQVIPVLHASDRGDLRRRGDLLDGDLGQAHVPDLSFLLEDAQRTDLIGERNRGVDAVQLVQPDLVQPEAAQAQLGLLAQVFGPAERDPAAAQVDLAALGGDHQVGRIRVERFGQQLLVVAEVIGIGGVDEGHAEFHRAAGYRCGGRTIQPGRISGQPHCPESEPLHPQVTADGHGSCRHASILGPTH